MDVEHADLAVSKVAAAIGEPARVRMLYSLIDGHARTGTELAVVADVSPSTASVHLKRLKAERLVKVLVQGKHRYYSLGGANVARALEALNVIAAPLRDQFMPTTPSQLLLARTCYDHMAGKLAVLLHNRLRKNGWLSVAQDVKGAAYDVTREGVKALTSVGVDLEEARTVRRRFAYACLDWSERQPHLGGALGAALLALATKKKWVVRDLDSRALSLTNLGRREFRSRFGLSM